MFLFLEDEDVQELIQDGLLIFYSRWRKYVGYLLVYLNVFINFNDGQLMNIECF